MGKRERERIERIHMGLEVPFKQRVIASNFIYWTREQRIAMGNAEFSKMLNQMVRSNYVPAKDGC